MKSQDKTTAESLAAQFYKRTRGRLTDEQKLESQLLRKSAKFHKQSLPERRTSETAEQPVGTKEDGHAVQGTGAVFPAAPDVVSAAVGTERTTPRSGTAIESPFSSISAPDLPPAGFRRRVSGTTEGSEAPAEWHKNPETEGSEGQQGAARLCGSAGQRKSGHSREGEAAAQDPGGQAGEDGLPLPNKGSIQIMEDAGGSLAETLSNMSISNMSINWLEKMLSQKGAGVSPGPSMQLGTSAPLETGVAEPALPAMPSWLPDMRSLPSLPSLPPVLNGVSEALRTRPAPPARSEAPLSSSVPSREAGTQEMPPKLPVSAVLPPPPTLVVPSRSPPKVRVIGMDGAASSSFRRPPAVWTGGLTLARPPSFLESQSQELPSDIITPVEMPLRAGSNLPAPSSSAAGVGGNAPPLADNRAWYITPQGVLTPVLPAPGVSWGTPAAPTPGVVYSALGRRRGRPRKKPLAGPAVPAPPVRTIEEPGPSGVTPFSVQVTPGLAASRHAQRSISMPKGSVGVREESTFRTASLPVLFGHGVSPFQFGAGVEVPSPFYGTEQSPAMAFWDVVGPPISAAPPFIPSGQGAFKPPPARRR